MDPAHWERIQALFHRASELPAADRCEWVTAQARGDQDAIDQVMALLANDAVGDAFLDRELRAVAKQLLNPVEAPERLRFGPYRIRRLLGEGGMGVVYLGHRDDLQAEVAVKVLRDAWLSPARRERFEAEQRVLARLQHAGIAQIHDAGVLADGTPWFAMEYVAGVPITEHCRSRPLEERLRLFRTAAVAVAHAHRHAIIHRDLKPSNILVTHDGQVKLLDFGIAKPLEALDDPAAATRTALRMMTPAYAAPEQFRGSGLGVHTDGYSLGVILYELLAGRLPYDLAGKTQLEVEALVMGSQPDKPSLVSWIGALPGDQLASRSAWADLDVLCLTAMHRDPERRYRTVEALIRDIDHFLANEPLDARPDSFGYRANKFVRRHRAGVAAAGLMFATLAAVVGFYTVRLRASRDAALAEAARAERIQSFTMRLFEGGDDEVGPADTLRVAALLERGVREARSLSQDPEAQAELFVTLGSIYEQLGRFAEADTLLQAALRLQTGPKAFPARLALALLRTREAKYPEALRMAQETRTEARAAYPPTHPLVARATATIGRIFAENGDYDSAQVALDSAATLLAASDPGSADLATALSLLATTHFYAGHYQVSDSLNRQVLAMSRRLYGDRHPSVGDDLINLGEIQFEQGNYPNAERYFREALDIFRAWHGDEHVETASAMSKVGRTLVSLQRDVDAEPLVLGALAIYRRVYGRDHPRVATALNDVGRLAQRRGQLDDAEAAFREVTSIYQHIYQNKHYLIGVGLSNLAGVLQDKGDYQQAIRLFREVLHRYAEVLEPNHQLVGIAHVRLGGVLLAAKDDRGAAAESQTGLDLLLQQSAPPPKWVADAQATLAEAKRRLRASTSRRNDPR